MFLGWQGWLSGWDGGGQNIIIYWGCPIFVRVVKTNGMAGVARGVGFHSLETIFYYLDQKCVP